MSAPVTLGVASAPCTAYTGDRRLCADACGHRRGDTVLAAPDA
ncbi:hypothetical protein [Dactylosporangium sp. NPDC048998]